ncbi:hypothetical protein J8F10_21825 [Gemmata sp. G18]|uniref:Uncharacterized protein n=1 Tax=Gemmata palustris TaxID=2822762 RepID=A0ABS5BVZ5_9BACT|nr:hypothetical protein [Gemmata palustris]MBP3957902.1 hypothetical protein [Gemmata palustris]
MPRPPKPQVNPSPCPLCRGGRIWWPEPRCALGYVPACVGCNAESLGDVPEDGFPYDAATVMEMKSL